ncbi:MAG: hypothetical protein LBH24_03965 [Clostridiales bacterium]|jgi:hypothetical protein|nr:hypothetical protein [Clostridiales bacterium]
MAVFFAILFAAAGLSAFLLDNRAAFSPNDRAENSAVQTASLSGSLRGSYLKGAEMTVPARSEYIGGILEDGVPTVIFPDGSTTQSETVTLSQTGKYTVEYAFYQNGAYQYTATEAFLVYERLASVSGTGSAVYGKYDPASTREGLVVNMRFGSELTVNQVIDMSGKTKNTPFIRLFAAPQKPDAYDFSLLTFTLTDIRDESNKLTVLLRYNASAGAQKWSYLSAGANGQAISGLDGARIQRNNAWGSAVDFSFFGNVKPYESYPLGISLDTETRELYGLQASGSQRLVIDLDSLAHFDDSVGGLWHGFSSDLVRLTIKPGEFANDANSVARFVITDIPGVDLSQAAVIDGDDPEISVDMQGYAAPPDAPVGCRYPIFPASAFDRQSGILGVTADVYANYDSPGSKEKLDVSDGGFVPAQAGRYVIEYTASDPFGNEKKTTVEVTAVNSAPAVDVSALYHERVTDGYAGTRIPVAAIRSTGGIGRVDRRILVSGEGFTSLVTDGYFVAPRAGVYAVVYEARDFVGRFDMYVYNVNVTYAAAPVFSDDPALPKQFLGGFSYALPELAAYRITASGSERVAATAAVTLDGTPLDISGGRANITPAGDRGTAVVTYTAGTSQISYTVPVVNAKSGGALDLTKFFYADDGITVTARTDDLQVSTQAASAGFEYARALVAEGFGFRFELVPEMQAYTALSFILTDSADAAQTVAVSFVPAATQTLMKINGNDAMLYAAGFSAARELVLSQTENKIVFGTGFAHIRQYADGRPFQGFSSGLIRLRFSFDGVSGGSAVNVKEINNQLFNGRIRNDTTAPMFALVGNDYGGTYTIGSKTTIPRLIAADVLAPDSSATVSVAAPDGASWEADAFAEYQISLEQYGSYVVYYTVKDLTSNRTANYSFVIIVDKVTPPEITAGFDPPAAVKAGTLVAVPTATATDLDGNEAKVYRYLFTTKGTIIELGDSIDSFRADSAGIYTLRYMAIDALGNTAYREYKITVTGGNE